MVGKYTGYEDSYKSLNEALYHGGFANRLRINIQWVEAEALEQDGGRRLLEGRTASSVPGGFGSRGTRGMMKAAEYARRHQVPVFGICYGFQWATVEFARNVCMLEGADSTEVDEAAPHRVIYKLRDLLGVDDLGGTMRLGSLRVRAGAGLAGAQDLRRRPDLRASSPSLRVQLPLRADAARGRACASPAARPTASSSRSPSCRATRGSSRCSSIPSSSRGRSEPHPLFASFVGAASRRSRQAKPAESATLTTRLGELTVAPAGATSVARATRSPFIAGPCVIESESHAIETARALGDDRDARACP